MPLYEYYCEDCDGIFELIRPIRESSDPQPCVVCDGDGRRLMPTEIHAFTVRGGLPRRIPDQNLYWTPKGLSRKPMVTDNMKKMEPFLVKDPRIVSGRTKLTDEELAAGKAAPIDVRERTKGTPSRGRRRARGAGKGA